MSIPFWWVEFIENVKGVEAPVEIVLWSGRRIAKSY